MTDMTPERLAELRAVAEAATEGPWSVQAEHEESEFGDWIAYGIPTVAPVQRFHDSDPAHTALDTLTQEDASHIAAFDPPTVLRLIAALEAANDRKPGECFTCGAQSVRELTELEAAQRERDEARAALDDLAADPGHKAAKYWKWWQREKARADRAETALERVTRDEFADKIARRVHATNHGDDDEPDKDDLDPNYAAGKHGQDILALIRAETGAEQ